MSTNQHTPTAADRRRWNQEDGEHINDALADAAKQLALAMNAAIVSGKPIDRVIEVPTSFSPLSALEAVSDMMREDASDQISSEMLEIIGALACKPDCELGARAAKWVESVSKAFGAYWAEDLVKEWEKTGHEPVIIPVNFRMEAAYQSTPTQEQMAAVDEMAGVSV